MSTSPVGEAEATARAAIDRVVESAISLVDALSCLTGAEAKQWRQDVCSLVDECEKLRVYPRTSAELVPYLERLIAATRAIQRLEARAARLQLRPSGPVH